jgi:HlyD family secretion protein
MALKFRLLSHGVPLAGAAALTFAIMSVAGSATTREQTEPPLPPPVSPYTQSVAGTGLVEPASEVIALAIERGGVVTRVDVVAGERVQADQPLFAIDDREYREAAAEAQGAVAAAQASIATIEQDILLQSTIIDQADAKVKSAQAERDRAIPDRDRYAKLITQNAVSRQQLENAVAVARSSEAAVAAAKAELASARQRTAVLAAQKVEAAAKLQQAQATLGQARVALDKTVVRAPNDGEILKVNIRRGEYAEAGELPQSLMTMGVTNPLHVRVDVDEADAQQIAPTRAATARLRGDAEVSTPLRFVRVEPAVVPKRQLSGAPSSERVDTRVLQVIYAFDPKDFPAYVGQQVDVFVDASGRKLARRLGSETAAR